MSDKKEELKNIQNETIIKNKENAEKPKKRGRGRPPKSESKKSEINASPNEGIISGLKSSFVSVFSFIGKSLSVTLKYKDFELEKSESELLAEQADQVVIEFFPQINNRYAKLGIFITTLITIFGKKYFSYASEQDKKLKIEIAKKENEIKKEQENILVGKNQGQTVTDLSGFNV